LKKLTVNIPDDLNITDLALDIFEVLKLIQTKNFDINKNISISFDNKDSGVVKQNKNMMIFCQNKKKG
jgi:hypothetical protein